MTTTLDIAAIRARLRSATPGEWLAWKGGNPDAGYAIDVTIDAQYITAGLTHRHWGDKLTRTDLADTDLIAHAPSDLAALCDRLTALMDVLRIVAECRDGCGHCRAILRDLVPHATNAGEEVPP